MVVGIALEVVSRVFARRDAASGQVEMDRQSEPSPGQVKAARAGIALLQVGTLFALAAVFAGDFSKSWSQGLWITAAVCMVASAALSFRRQRS